MKTLLRHPRALPAGLALALLISVGINVRTVQLWFAAEEQAADAVGAKEMALGEVEICKLEAERAVEAAVRNLTQQPAERAAVPGR